MATIKRYDELEIWQLARELCKSLNEIVDDSWYRKDSSLKAQILGSSGSVMDNIAEGFERGSTKEFVQFLGYAKGSCGEFRSQLTRAFDKDLLTEVSHMELNEKAELVSKKINSFISYLNTVNYKGNRFMEDEVIYGNPK